MILFAKAPAPGRVKTRLQPPLTAVQAAGLHSAFVYDMIDKAKQFASLADVELHTDTHTDAWSSSEVARRVQIEGDLGCKMLHAIEERLAAGAPQVIILGTDAPTLPAEHLAWLLGCPADVALGPSEDGGYWSIACRRAHPAMFDAVPWSRPDTLEATLRAVRACGLSVELAPPWFDIDSPADLKRLRTSPDLPQHTAAWLRRHK
ncbi:MAG: TIGR04282 family arsenosugar biosynthesis glycosyltransferase [Bryobacteraceae bacterium]